MKILRSAALGLAIIFTHAAQAGVVQVFSRASIGTTTFDFDSFGAAGTVLSTPVTEPGGPGSVTVASSVGVLYIDQQATSTGSGTGTGSVWYGNFAGGDHLLAQTADDRSDTFIVAFSGAPVFGVGTQIQPSSTFYGNFTGNMLLFSATNVELGEVSINGDSTNAADNSAPFIGATSTTPIAYVEFNVATGFPGFPTEGDLAINDLTLNVPEPATALTLASALLGIGLVRRRRSHAC